MGIKERRNKEKEAIRKLILNAAGEIFASEGLENASIRKIAAKIDYSPTTIYLYFKDKKDLFDCLIEDAFQKLLQMSRIIMYDGDDLLETLKKALRIYVDFGMQYPNHYRVAFMTEIKAPAEAYFKNEKTSDRVFNNLRDIVRECVKKNFFRLNNVELISQIFWAIDHGITSLIITNPNCPWADREKLIDETIEAVITGLMR